MGRSPMKTFIWSAREGCAYLGRDGSILMPAFSLQTCCGHAVLLAGGVQHAQCVDGKVSKENGEAVG